jgi:hypothetical protein
MTALLRVSNIRFVAAPPDVAATGLKGWVSCLVADAIHLDGITLRRSAAGKLVLSYPRRRDGSGRRRYYIRPRDDNARRHIEACVFRALAMGDGSPAP